MSSSQFRRPPYRKVLLLAVGCECREERESACRGERKGQLESPGRVNNLYHALNGPYQNSRYPPLVQIRVLPPVWSISPRWARNCDRAKDVYDTLPGHQTGLAAQVIGGRLMAGILAGRRSSRSAYHPRSCFPLRSAVARWLAGRRVERLGSPRASTQRLPA